MFRIFAKSFKNRNIFKIVIPIKSKRIVVRRKRVRSRVLDTSWKTHTLAALELVNKIIDEVQLHHNFVFKDIKIRNQKTRWGSCSSKGNLNFNYKIVKLPYELAKYLVIHELCHLEYLDHSRNFWKLVETLEPNYKQLQKALKHYVVT